MKLLHLSARPLLGSLFVTAGIETLREPEPRAEMAGPFLEKVRGTLPALPRDDVQLVRVNAAVQVAAGALLGIGRLPRLSALALCASLIPTNLAGNSFWEHDDPAERAQRRTQFLKDSAIVGGLLAVVSDASHLARARALRHRARQQQMHAWKARAGVQGMGPGKGPGKGLGKGLGEGPGKGPGQASSRCAAKAAHRAGQAKGRWQQAKAHCPGHGKQS